MDGRMTAVWFVLVNQTNEIDLQFVLLAGQYWFVNYFTFYKFFYNQYYDFNVVEKQKFFCFAVRQTDSTERINKLVCFEEFNLIFENYVLLEIILLNYF